MISDFRLQICPESAICNLKSSLLLSLLLTIVLNVILRLLGK